MNTLIKINNKKKVALFSLMLSSFAFVSVYGRTQENNPTESESANKVKVPVEVVKETSFQEWADFSGKIEAIQRVDVRARVSGMLKEVHFTEGSIVNKGQLLVTIDDAPYRTEVARAKAELKAALAREAQAKVDLVRAQSLFKKNMIAETDVDSRTNAASEASANVMAAQANLDSAELNLGYTRVYAEITGRIGRLSATSGNLISALAGAEPLTTIVSVDPVYASFDADEQSVTKIISKSPNNKSYMELVNSVPVQIVADDGVFQGRLQFVDNLIDGKTGTVRLRALFDNKAHRFIPGQFTRIRLGQPENTKGILVNDSVIGTDQEKKFVFVVGDKNVVEYREVQLGNKIEGRRIIKSGLKEGERIVVSGIQRIRQGALVEPVLNSSEQ